jgi:hypothetical protein
VHLAFGSGSSAQRIAVREEGSVSIGKQRGVSLLFTVLLVALAGLVVVWLVKPWFVSARNEKTEKDVNRGVAPSAMADPSTSAARERAEAHEFAEARGDLKALVGTEHYRALSAPCRELVDAYVSLADKPADAAADTAADRASAAEIERRFGASCVDGAPAAPAAASAATQMEDLREQTVLLEASIEAYRALSPQCRSYFDTFADARNRADVSPADRERIAEAERLFKANCVDREAGAREVEKARTRLAEDDRRICAHKREEAAQVRALVNLTLAEEREKPGTIDADKEGRRKSLEENQRRLGELEADIATGCP